MKLRAYQSDVQNDAREKFRVVSAVLLVLATGAGKTVIFSDTARKSANLGKRVLILAHRDMLLRQASQKLRAYGVDHGMIMAAYTPTLYKKVQVASVQTLIRRLDKIKTPFDLLIIDEAHLSSAKSYLKIVAKLLELNPAMKILGVTATASRLDGKGLGRHSGGLFDDMVVGISSKELIDQKFLVKPIVFTSPNSIDLSGVKMIGADYDSEALADVMDKPVITGDAISHWRRICPDVPAVVWCANVAHAEHVAAEFNAAGIPAQALSGEDDSTGRDRALRAMEKGTLKIITFAMLLVEGVDCPAIGAVILLRPTLSLVSYLQVIGRGLRPIYADGFDLETLEGRSSAIDAGPKGNRCFVLDHAGLAMRHGLPHWEREWSLDGRQKKRGSKKEEEISIALKQCPKCFLVHSPEPSCPHCGYLYPDKNRAIEQVDGELHEVTAEMEQEMEQAALDRKRREQGNARSVEEMVEKLGYSVKRAEKVVAAREEKRAVADALVADLQAWREKTGETAISTFGVAISDLRSLRLKPKEMKELRERFDAHVRARAPVAQQPGDDKEFGDYLRRTLGARSAPVQQQLADGEEF